MQHERFQDPCPGEAPSTPLLPMGAQLNHVEPAVNASAKVARETDLNVLLAL